MQSHKIVDFARRGLGVTLHPGQAEALSGYYTSGRPNWLLLAGRRGGKSLMSDIVASYEAVIPDFADVLRPGEVWHVLIVSVRQDNAGLHIRNIAGLLRHTPELAGLVAYEGKESIELMNGARIVSLPASARAGRGFTASTLIFDELAHFVDTLGNASGDSVFDAFTPTVATFDDRARIVVTTTPAARTGIVYELFDKALPDWYVTRAATRQLNPNVSQKVIDRAALRDPDSARVEYEAEFAEPIAAFLDSDAIQRAIDFSRQRAEGAEAGQQCVAAIDPATMSDRYAFCIAHRSDGRIILDYAQALYPPVDPAAAEDLLLDLYRRFRPVKVLCDTASTSIRLAGQLPIEYAPFTRPVKLRIYGALKEALNLGQLSLYSEPELLDELRHLQIRNGVDIAAPKSGRVTHDDLADCLALVCDALADSGPEPASAVGLRGTVHAARRPSSRRASSWER